MTAIIASIITGVCTLTGVIVSNGMQLRRQTQELKAIETVKKETP